MSGTIFFICLTSAISAQQACVSERQISRIVRSIRDSRFPNIHIFICVYTSRIRIRVHPRFADQNNIRSSQVHTWEYLVLLGL